MKFMKLGCRPDTFYTAEAVRSVSSELSTDLIIQVKGNRYLLHKFPMLCKCLRLQRLLSSSDSPETSQHQVIQLQDFPGGIEAFEVCAKFCYGITITLSAYNVVATRCAAEYLQMTEDAEKGNLIQKLELFLTSCIFNGWKDCIVTLQSTKEFPLYSEDLGITSRCIEAMAEKVSVNPLKMSLSRSRSTRNDVSCNGNKWESSQWWAEDMADLGIDLYWRTMIAIKSCGKLPSRLIADALKIYASRWLPDISNDEKFSNYKSSVSDYDSESDSGCSKHRLLLESIVSLLPAEKGSVSCSFLLKLLKTASILNASSLSKMELARKTGLQLDKATVGDLLIPLSPTKSGMLYDVEIVVVMLEEFMSQTMISPPKSPTRSKLSIERRKSRSEQNINLELQESRRSSSVSHGSKLKVAKLVDGYLQAIAKDVNLPLSKFVAVAEMVPEFSRVDHDDLYKAIDIYLKVHPNLSKSERKRLCRILDCKKLSTDASTHAAQNELLPLRVIVQVLFFEQVRAAIAGANLSELPSNIHALLTDPSGQRMPLTSTTSIGGADRCRRVSSLRSAMSRDSPLRSKLGEDHNFDKKGLHPDGIGRNTPSRFKSFCAIPTRSKRIFSRLLSINRSSSEKN